MQARAWQYAREELFNVHFYTWLSQEIKVPALREILRNFAAEERRHYDFWREYLGKETGYSVIRLWWYKILVWLLGPTFVIKLLERGEHKTIAEYRSLAEKLPLSQREALLSLIEDEEKHEEAFMAAIGEAEPRVRYVGFIVLGLSDAIIEVTGVHAGFLGVSHRPLVAGIAGLIVGFAASISMASAAYLQAKQNHAVSALRSALYTGVSYLLAVVALALPYFFTQRMAWAFWLSVAVAVLLILAFVYYSCVLFERNFRTEAIESIAVLGGTTILSYGFGELLRWLFPDAAIG
jgi:VIT1/CCC1 family predicted Fe2+/Mn2+ transporter